MGDLFAPAYRANDPASVQEVNDWQNRVFNVNPGNIEQTRKPVAFNTGTPGGMLDPEALRMMAQGGPYDFGSRRDAIAAQVQQQAVAPAGGGVNPYGTAPPGYGANILGQSDWNTFYNAAGADAANAWAQQQYNQANSPDMIAMNQRAMAAAMNQGSGGYGGGFGGGAGDGSP